MRLPELKKRLKELSDLGFIPSERKGPTGIGHTLESRLGVSENNLPIPDIGGRVEIKATRSTQNNLITLFTFNKAAWQIPQADAVRRWGRPDSKNRPALYSTVSATAPNSLGLQITIKADAVSVVHAQTREMLATWDLYEIVGKFMNKFERLLLVHADSRKTGRIEEFYYHKALLLTEPGSKTFRKGFLSGKALIDIRMHLRPNGSVRNHGTGFRVREQDLPDLFGKNENLL